MSYSTIRIDDPAKGSIFHIPVVIDNSRMKGILEFSAEQNYISCMRSNSLFIRTKISSNETYAILQKLLYMLPLLSGCCMNSVPFSLTVNESQQ